MRVSTLLGSAALFCASIVAASDVLDLTADDFQSVISKEDLILVEFYAPWCGHCKALAPEYEEAATALKEKKLPIAKVDCVAQADLCNQHGVTGYPTLKVFRNGEASDYSGPRKADGIIQYMTKQSLPAVSVVTAANHAEFKAADKVVVVAYLPSTTEAPASAFSSVAEKYRDDYLFGLSSDAAAAEAAGVTPPAIVVYKTFDEGRNDFPVKGIKDTTAANLAKFIEDNSMPLLDEISGENYPSYSQSGLPLAYLFLDPAAADKDAHIDAIKPIAKKHKGAVNFVWIDAIKYVDHAKSLNVKTDTFPAFVIQDMAEGLKFPLQDATPSFATVDDFVAKYVAGKIEPSLKSEAVPADNDGPVKVIVGTQYNEIVNDDEKDVFVEFYAPWCGHCKRLAPIWDDLGSRFADVKDKITVAKMDATENDLPAGVPFKIAGFPTIKFKPAGSKEFVDYEGDRSLDSLFDFAMKHAKNNVTPPTPSGEAKTEGTSTQVSPSGTAHAHDHEHDHVEL